MDIVNTSELKSVEVTILSVRGIWAWNLNEVLSVCILYRLMTEYLVFRKLKDQSVR